MNITQRRGGNIVQMPTAVKMWEITNDALRPVTDDSFAKIYLEKELEGWIEREPSLLGDRVLIIARQQQIPDVGRLDLLGVDQSGSLVIIELKRDHTPREAVAQALDYASWLHSASEPVIAEWAEQYLKQPLKKAFCEYFDTDSFPVLSCQKHRIVLVAPRLDASAERIITYLSEKYAVEINAVFFQYARLKDGKEILARAMLVAEPVPAISIGPTKPTVSGLLKMAAESGTVPLVDACRAAGGWWYEEAESTFDGSFRYWATTSTGQERMVFGVNVAGKAKPPHGQLDVWIPPAKVSEVTGWPEDKVIEALKTQPIANISMGINSPCWIRLKTGEEARNLIQQLRQFSSEGYMSNP